VVHLFLLVALISQSPSVPDTTVMIRESDVVVIVYPPARRTVKSVMVQPHPTREAAQIPKLFKPRTRAAFPNRGVMATFDLPASTFHVVVTLDDNSEHRVDEQERVNRVYTVTPFRGDLPPKETLPKG
jgi:hypothetical protein